MLDRFRETARRLLMGPSKSLTQEQLAARIEAATQDLAHAESAVEQVQAAYLEATAAPDLEELAVSRAYKKLKEAEQKVDRCKLQLKAYEAMTAEVRERIDRDRRARQVQAIERLLSERIVICKELDEILGQFAERLARLATLNRNFLEAAAPLPRRGWSHLPDLFALDLLQAHIELRLFAHTAGAWKPKRAGFENAHTARQKPALETLAVRERETVRIMYSIDPDDEPPAAA
jgi:hypothetical protein